jgi:glycosyltransferase involved in cell wall biosynthesis
VQKTFPRVSVLIPVYNGERFLRAALDSVISQTEAAWELIVVDDGSTDGSSEILREYAAADPRVRVFHKPNSGISDTLNAGLRHARAAWIARLDADDVMLPHRLERQLAFVAEHPDLVAAGSDYELIDQHGAGHGTRYPLPRSAADSERLFQREALLAFTHPTMLYRTEAARAVGGYQRALEPCEDLDLFTRLMLSEGAIRIQPESLTRYRVHAGSISSRSGRAQWVRQRFICHNFYAQRAGRAAIGLPEFLRLERQRPVPARLSTWIDFQAEMLLRRYTAAKIANRPVLAAGCLGAASALRPVRAIRRGLRTMLPAVQNTQSAPS